MSEKVTQLHPQQESGTQQGELTRQFRGAALDALSGLLDAMFDGADDALFAMVEKAESNADQNLYFDAMRAVRLERPNISRMFIDELARALRHGPAPAASLPVDGSLGLMPPDELEETVAVSNLVAKANGLFRGPAGDLEGRLSQLAEREQSELASNGLSPASLGHAFKQAMAPVDLEISVKLLIYKLFDRALIARLETVYTDLNRRLARQDIQPRSSGAAAVSAPQAKAARGEHSARWAQRLADLDEEITPESHFGTREVLAGLNALEAGDRMSGGDDPAGLLDALLRQLRSGQLDSSPRALQRDERRLIGLVATMFNDILEDGAVAPAAKSLVARVRLPVIKAALLDAGFFRDADHPARRLVNELSTLTLEPDSAAHQQARALVDDLVAGFEDDPRVLDTVVEALSRLGTQRDGASTDARAQRRAQLLDKAKRMALLELRQQTLGRRPPPAAIPFLLKAWGPLLAIAYIRHGLDSDEWLASVGLLTRMLDELQAPAGEAERSAQRSEQEQLRALIRKRLSGLPTGRGRLSQLLEGLDEAFAQANASQPEAGAEDDLVSTLADWEPDDTAFDDEGSHDATDSAFEQALAASIDDAEAADAAPSGEQNGDCGAATQSPTDDAGQEPDTTAQAQTAPAAALEDFLATTCKPGVWFQIHTGNERGTRWLKVQRYEREARQVVFANREGTPVLTRDALAFADDLQAGRSQPIYDVEDFERKLAGIIGGQARSVDDPG